MYMSSSQAVEISAAISSPRRLPSSANKSALKLPTTSGAAPWGRWPMAVTTILIVEALHGER